MLQRSRFKLLHSSIQTSADHRSRRRHVSRVTDEKGETVSLRNVKSEEQAWVSSGRLFHARAAATGKAWSPRVSRRVDDTCSVVVSSQQRGHIDERRSLMSAAGCQTGTPVLCHAHNGTPEHTAYCCNEQIDLCFVSQGRVRTAVMRGRQFCCKFISVSVCQKLAKYSAVWQRYCFSCESRVFVYAFEATERQTNRRT